MFNSYQILSTSTPEPLRNVNLRGAYPYDIDNAYPQRVAHLATKVPQVSHGIKILNQFCIGQGITGPGADEVVNAGKMQVFLDKNKVVRYLPLSRPETLQTFFAKVVACLGLNNGAYIHVGFASGGNPISYTLMEFENMRIVAPDDRDNAGKFVWWNNWTGSVRGNSRDAKPPVYYSPYTGDNATAAAEMAEMGNKFPGQVYYIKYSDLWDSGLYPISPLHSVLGVADSAWQLNVYINSLIRNGFHQSDTLMLPYDVTPEAKLALEDDIKRQRGTSAAGATLILAGMQEGSKLEKRDTNGQADQFRFVEDDLTRKIRMGLGVPTQLFGDLQAGRLGNTSELKDAFEIYNQQTAVRRRFAADSLSFLFANTAIPGVAGQTFEVEPLQFEGTTIAQPLTQPIAQA